VNVCYNMYSVCKWIIVGYVWEECTYLIKCLMVSRSGMLSVLRVVYVMRRGGVVICCYLCGYSLNCWYIVSYIGLFCSVPNSFMCMFAILVRHIQDESKVCLENLRACSEDQNSKNVSVNMVSEILPYLDIITEWRTHIPVTKSLLRCI
jgi:hypothetical protein